MMTKVTARLAQAPWAAEGDPDDRLDLQLRLDPQARPDLPAYEADPGCWTATRHQPGQASRTRKLVLMDGGWALGSLHGDDEPLWTLAGDMFRPGEIIDLRPPDGTALLFRIVSVEDD